MNPLTPEAATAANLPTLQSNVDSEISNLAEQESPKRPSQIEQNAIHKIEIDAERIRSSIGRLTSNSIGELEGLASELGKLDEFLKSETGRVQREIESVLAGIKIIIDAIAPWKRPSPAPAGSTRAAPSGARSHASVGLEEARRGR
jgi:hypothetical protein